ncbi:MULTISPECIES: hypothetical protein [unclassified Pseudonocardia]|nr:MULTISPECIES: hypothetical protein [unclassified Pseudonocardia]
MAVNIASGVASPPPSSTIVAAAPMVCWIFSWSASADHARDP